MAAPTYRTDPLDKLGELLTEPCLTDEARERLAEAMEGIRRERRRTDFVFERTVQDKLIATRMLDRTIRDLEHKSAELDRQRLDLAENNRRLELANDEMQSFMHVASHDLKTPLRSIGSFANLLARRFGDELSGEAAEYFSYIKTNAQGMNRVIDDLVAYNRVGVGAHFEEVCLDEVVTEVLLGLSSDIEQAGAKIEVAPLGRIVTARSAVRQLLQNLIGNAIVHRHDSRALAVQVWREPVGASAALIVEDNGVGLCTSFADKVFQPFKRVGDQSRPGTGMGLAICRRLARQLGGDVTYVGEVGVGTRFEITLGACPTPT